MASQREKRMKVSALLRAGHKVSEVANLVGVSPTTVYAFKKRMDDGEGINKLAGSGGRTVVYRDNLRGMPFEGLLRLRDAIRVPACGMPSKGEQSFDQCLHVC